ncbi:MAG TPA: response regulator [Bacteroidia bacterium]|nr:response regulator [Bacteroidia bacterium]
MKSWNINILLADDDKDDCMFFKEALDEIDLTTHLTTVYDGEQLMQHLQTRHLQLPDMLFLDLNMPLKNGFACLEEIKQNEKLKSLPVIIFSTSYEEKIANQLHLAGAQHYICKPADFPLLKKVIQQAIILIMESKGVFEITNKSESQPRVPSKENYLLSNFKTLLL